MTRPIEIINVSLLSSFLWNDFEPLDEGDIQRRNKKQLLYASIVDKDCLETIETIGVL